MTPKIITEVSELQSNLSINDYIRLGILVGGNALDHLIQKEQDVEGQTQTVTVIEELESLQWELEQLSYRLEKVIDAINYPSDV